VADQNRTEQATPRRRQKARERGQVARSRELPAALAMLAVILFLWAYPALGRGDWRNVFGRMLATAVGSDIGPSSPLPAWTGWAVVRWAAPVLLLGWTVALGASFLQGGFVFAPAALAPKPERLNPASNLQRLFSLHSLRLLLKSLLPLGCIMYLTLGVVTRDWGQLLMTAHQPPRLSLGWMLERAFEISWKAGLVFLAWAGLDVLLERYSFEQSLRMTHEEVREDFKETEGHPAVRARVRRLQRQMRRRRMLREVARATVVVTNPTEYAVALEYRPEEMPAPVVVAKGRNRLAQLIKREAQWREIPVVENPPLAQALYRAVEVGQAIPAKLYAAVAEILAFLYRAQARARAAAARPPGPPRIAFPEAKL